MGTGCEKVKNRPSAFRVKSRSHAISPCLEAGVWGWVRFEYAVEHREYNRQKCSDN